MWDEGGCFFCETEGMSKEGDRMYEERKGTEGVNKDTEEGKENEQGKGKQIITR